MSFAIINIHGSLAIEGNTIPENLITDIIEGRHVAAPPREIQEVKNAIKTYDAFSSLDPYNVQDLLRAHALMMDALVDDAGHFRSGGVGVFSGNKAIHAAPAADRVSSLMNDLFDWLKKSDDHLLIKSSVFHYEFEFIHPFIDGNGRLGRLWQSLILSKLHPIFEYLPVENMVFQNQQKYYNDKVETICDNYVVVEQFDSGAKACGGHNYMTPPTPQPEDTDKIWPPGPDLT